MVAAAVSCEESVGCANINIDPQQVNICRYVNATRWCDVNYRYVSWYCSLNVNVYTYIHIYTVYIIVFAHCYFLYV